MKASENELEKKVLSLQGDLNIALRDKKLVDKQLYDLYNEN